MNLTILVGEVQRGDLHRDTAGREWMAENDARPYGGEGAIVIDTTRGPRIFAECQLIVVER